MEIYDDILNNSPSAGQGVQFSKEEYAAMKKAERDDVFALSDQTAIEVAEDGDKFRQYLDTQARFDRYSAVNTLLIMAQMPEATKLGDFEHWKDRGASVKRGQTGIAILEPHEYTKEDGLPGTGYNIKKVFDVSQMDTRKAKAAPTPAHKYEERQLLKALIHKAPMKISGVDELPDDLGAVTDPDTGEISVRKGMEFADTFQNVAQELGYYEADRDADKIPINPSFVGYCTSYILCKKHGIDTQGFDFSPVSDVFRDKDAQGIKKELSIIRDAAGEISGRMAKQLDAAQKSAANKEAR